MTADPTSRPPEAAGVAEHRGRVLRWISSRSLFALTAKGFHGVLVIATSVVLARALGDGGFGAVATALAWIAVLSVPCQLGLDVLLLRTTPPLPDAPRVAAARHNLPRGIGIVAVCAIAVGALFAAGTWTLRRVVDPAIVPALLTAGFALPFVCVTRLQRSVLQGVRAVASAQVPEHLVLLVAFLLFVALPVAFSFRLDPAHAVLGYAAGAMVATLAAALLLRIALPRAAVGVGASSSQAGDSTPTLVRRALPLSVWAVLQMTQAHADVILLGAIADAPSAGRYAAASRIASVLGLLLTALNEPLAPYVARCVHSRDLSALRRVVPAAARIAALLAVVAGVAVVRVAGELRARFGPALAGAKTGLGGGVGAQFFNVAMGPVGMLLLMAGAERGALVASGASLVVTIVLDVVLIPGMGATGAAIAALAAMITWNLTMAWMVHRRLGVDATALGLFSLLGFPRRRAR